MSSPRSDTFRAPGRVNIIGEHIDYLGGTVLPFACDLELTIDARYRPGDIDLRSADASSEVFVRGVVSALEEAGIAYESCEGEIRSNIPVGAGLSSSTALSAAIALAVTGGEKPTPQLLLRAEVIATGVPGGLMDQTTILDGRKDHALLLDCATGAIDHVPIHSGVGFVVIDTGTRRALSDGRYAQRRQEVETGHPARRRHAETEQARVYEAADALRRGDVDALGSLIHASHVSLRDDFDVSAPELDAAVAVAEAHPACTGARLVGAGFAGCVIAIVHKEAEAEVAGIFDRAWPVRAVDGAGPVTPA